MALDSNDLPQTFGHYTLLRRIAVGGMAEVYVAKTGGVAGFEKLVALKVIHPRFSEDEHFTQMLVEEAKIAVLLTHVNIAQTFDLGKIEDTYYIAMELIEGADAYRVMRRCAELKKAIPIDVATFVVAEMCNGLDFAHRKRDPNTGQPLNIVHRDISPQNVLISNAGEVKIVDFGIAKAASRSTQTEVGVIKGKYYYMSPEQAWGDPMDHRSDVFSTGVVLYELLTGRMLYNDADVPTLLDKVRKADIPRPETRRPSIPRALSDIVMKALAKEPADRWSSAGEMGQALHQFLYSVSPTFSATRLADLLALLFPNESGNAPPLESLPPVESPAPAPAKPGFDLGDDDEDDATRNDVLPYKRKLAAEAAAAAAAQVASAPPAVVPARPAGRTEPTKQIDAHARVSSPLVGPSGAWIAPVTSDSEMAKRDLTTDARSSPVGAWDDDTDLAGGAEEDFSDSTLVDANLARAVRSAPSEAGGQTTTEQIESPRGRVVVNRSVDGASTRQLAIKSSLAYDNEDTTNEIKRALPAVAAIAPPAKLPTSPSAAPPARPLPRGKLSDRPPPPRALPRPPAPHLGRGQLPGPPAPPGQPMISPQAIAAQAAQQHAAQQHAAQQHAAQQAAAQQHAAQQHAAQQHAAQQHAAQQHAAQHAAQQHAAQQHAAQQHAAQQHAAQHAAQGGHPLATPYASQGFPGTPQGFPAPYGTVPLDPLASPPAAGQPQSYPVIDPFAPAPMVTGGLPAIQSPRGFPWALLAVGLLLLAVLVGAIVYVMVPAPAPAFEISSLPPGATVTVDGRSVGTTPVAIRDGLVVGQTYSFQVALDGHETSAFELRAVAATDRREVVLSPLPAVLRVETVPPGAQVQVGGASRGAAPVDVGGLFVGAEVDVRVDAPGHHPRTVHVRMPAAQHVETVRLEPMR